MFFLRLLIEDSMTLDSKDNPTTMSNDSKKQEIPKHHFNRDATLGGELWTDGLICAFKFIRGSRKSPYTQTTNTVDESQKPISKPQPTNPLAQNLSKNGTFGELEAKEIDTQDNHLDCLYPHERPLGNYWIPIGWNRISQLVETVQVDVVWASQPLEIDDEDDITVADVAAPYWERPVGPTWWCHVDAVHPSINSWLSNAQWLHPVISIALRDESRLISERMKHLLYEVPVRVAGGLLFELLGQSVGDPCDIEEDLPVVIRSWQAQKFLLTALHVKGTSSNINVLGVSEVQELLAAGGSNIPRTSHEVIALLACRLARWDDRLFRKYILGAADEVELKFMNRRTREDMHMLSIILNQEIRTLSTQICPHSPLDKVKWCLHAREEIVFELLQHVRGNAARSLLEGMKKSTREMIQEQEAVRGRLFTIQDVMQSTVCAWLQDQSLRVQHNLGVFGGCGLVLSIITGLWGVNVDGIPGHAPYSFAVFACTLVLVGVVLIAIGLIYLGLKKTLIEEKAEMRKVELDEVVKMFQQEAECHAQVRKKNSNHKTAPAAKGVFVDGQNFVLIN